MISVQWLYTFHVSLVKHRHSKNRLQGHRKDPTVLEHLKETTHDKITNILCSEVNMLRLVTLARRLLFE